MPYGLITPLDGRKLEESLRVAAALAVTRNEAFTILEVGICHGETSRGMAQFLRQQQIPFTYWGVDNQRDKPVTPPFPEANVLLGPSEELYSQLPAVLHFVFVDGCHCINHVMLDFLHYGDRVPVGGRLVMHDAAPYTQRKLDYQGHGPRDQVDFGTATREAARKLGLLTGLRQDWRLVEQAWEPRWDSGGVLVLERVAAAAVDA